MPASSLAWATTIPVPAVIPAPAEHALIPWFQARATDPERRLLTRLVTFLPATLDVLDPPVGLMQYTCCDNVRVRRMFCSSHERGDRVPALGPEPIRGWARAIARDQIAIYGVEQGWGGRPALQQATLDLDRRRVDTPTGDKPASLTA